MDWTEDAIARLRLLWAEGLSTAEIGRRLNISKNAVVGKAHRLALVARPSPIRRDPAGEARPRRPASPRVQGPTLPPLPEMADQPSGTNGAGAAEAAGPVREAGLDGEVIMRAEMPRSDMAADPAPSVPPPARPAMPAPARPALSRVTPVRPDTARPGAARLGLGQPSLVSVRPSPRGAACCWPIGEPGTPTFHFCGKPSAQGRPYCEAHAEIAYVRVRDRREDAA